MADVFISYSSADRERVEPIVEELERHGLSVWWDRRIELGSSFDKSIEAELDAAKCVLVVWSRTAVHSEWVLNEASEGRSRGVLVPIRIDDVRIPLEFRRLQTAAVDPSLMTGMDFVVNAVAGHVRGHPVAARTRSTGNPEGAAMVGYPPAATSARRRFVPFVTALGVLLVVGAVGIWISGIHMDESGSVASTRQFDFPRVAIMPMEVLTEDDALEYLARASEDDLRRRMQASIFEPVNVPRRALGTAVTEIGETYAVDYVWYRSVARNGDLVRVSKHLAETRTGRDVAVFQHDLHGSDPFELQDQLAKFTEEIMGAVETGERERANEIPLSEMNAWELLQTTKGDRLQNRWRALELAPDLFAANSAVAERLWWDYVMQRVDDPEAALEQALELSRRGWQLAPFDQFASHIAARVELTAGSPQMAIRYVTPFFDLKSLSSQGFYDVLIANGRVEEALAHAERNPIIAPETLGLVYLAAGQFERAAEQYEVFTKRSPDNSLAWFGYANSLAYLGRNDEVDQIVRGLIASGWDEPIVANYEIGLRRYWGRSGFGDVLVDGLKSLGYE